MVMKLRQGLSGVTVLAAAVLVLLPALAWLQYSWLDQIADADRDRRERTLRTATAQLAQDFENEIAKAMTGLQIDPAMAEQQSWAGYAARYQAWADAAIAPAIVKTIYFIEGPDFSSADGGTAPALRAWTPDTRTFAPAPWPADLESLKARVVRDERRFDIDVPGLPQGRGRGGSVDRSSRGPRAFERIILPPSASGGEQSIVLPVISLMPSDRPRNGLPERPPDLRLLGFTVLRLDLGTLGRDVLPQVVRSHLFDEAGHTDFNVAVVERNNSEHVIYESAEGAATVALAEPDATASLLGPRMGQMFVMRERGRGARVESDRVVISVMEGRREEHDAAVGTARLVGLNPATAEEGHWRLVAKHRAGSLEAAVGDVRRRNFFLSSGILALLGTAIGLIVVSARRADRLAKQQLEFVAAVSHELRTPVSVIGAAAENLADGVVGEPGHVKKYGETIQSESRRLAETVERVLQLAGIAAGRPSQSRAVIPVSALVHESVEACRYEIEQAGTTVEIAISDDLANDPTQPDGVTRTLVDVPAMKSALQNLIINAIKYGGEARWVRITADRTKRGDVRLAVQDRGLGIPADDRKHLFEPFYRGREAVSMQIRGNGLGLHLVRRIVDAHPRARVDVESEPGKGSTFTIELATVHEIVRRHDSIEVPQPKTT